MRVLALALAAALALAFVPESSALPGPEFATPEGAIVPWPRPMCGEPHGEICDELCHRGIVC